jgi:hypothetical protein
MESDFQKLKPSSKSKFNLKKKKQINLKFSIKCKKKKLFTCKKNLFTCMQNFLNLESNFYSLCRVGEYPKSETCKRQQQRTRKINTFRSC